MPFIFWSSSSDFSQFYHKCCFLISERYSGYPFIWGNFCFIFSMWGLFYYVFLIIVIALIGGGAIVGNRPLLKNLLFAWTPFCCLFAAFFSMWGLFCYVFLIIILRSLRGGGESKTWRLPSLKNEEKNMFCYMRGLLLLFLHVQFFATLFTMGGVFLLIFFYVGSLFCFYGGGAFFLLAPPTKTSAFYFCE